MTNFKWTMAFLLSGALTAACDTVAYQEYLNNREAIRAIIDDAAERDAPAVLKRDTGTAAIGIPSVNKAADDL